MGSLAHISIERWSVASMWQRFMEKTIELQFDDSRVLFVHIEAGPMLLEQICEFQKDDSKIQSLIEKAKSSGIPGFSIDNFGIL